MSSQNDPKTAFFLSVAVFSAVVATVVSGMTTAYFNTPEEAPQELVLPEVAPLVPRTDIEIENVVRNFITENPGFVLATLQERMRTEQAQSREDRKKLVVAQHDVIADTAGLPFIGDENGIEIIEFVDVNCGFCKRIHPELKVVLRRNPDVKLVHREMPVLGPNSRRAASISQIIWKENPEAYPEFHNRLMELRASSAPDQIGAVLEVIFGTQKAQEILRRSSPEIGEGFVSENVRVAEAAGITGTPFIYIPGVKEPIQGAVPDLRKRLQDAIDVLRKRRDAGD